MRGVFAEEPLRAGTVLVHIPSHALWLNSSDAGVLARNVLTRAVGAQPACSGADVLAWALDNARRNPTDELVAYAPYAELVRLPAALMGSHPGRFTPARLSSESLALRRRVLARRRDARACYEAVQANGIAANIPFHAILDASLESDAHRFELPRR